MPPGSRHDVWASLEPCSVVEVDCYLPTGVLIPIKVRIEAPLAEIKAKLWKAASNYPFFNLLKDPASYVFVCINQNGKQEELVEETRQLVDVRPYRPLLKLIERKGDREEKILQSNIGVLIGKNLDEFHDMNNLEVDEFRKNYRKFVEEIANERKQLDWQGRAMYAFPPEIEVSDEVPKHVREKLIDHRRFLVNVAISKNKISIKDLHAFNVSADTYPSELLVLVLKKRGAIMGMVHNYDNPADYILKIVGRERYLLGDYALLRYKYIRRCIIKGMRPQLTLVLKASLKVNELMDISGGSRDTSKMEEPPPVPRKPSISLWGISSKLRIKIVSACNVNAEMKELNSFVPAIQHGCRANPLYCMRAPAFRTSAVIARYDEVCVRAGIYHGGESLCDIKNTRPESGSEPVWNEGLDFDLSINDLPRMARLCLVIYVKTRKEESMPLAWVNTTLFDYQDNLQQGLVKLFAWPVPETMDELVNPLGTVVSNINTSTSPCLSIEFQRFANPVIYPSFEKVTELAADSMNRDIYQKFTEGQRHQLQEIIEKEPHAPMFEQDKELVWLLRLECRESYPHSLPKLLCCVKWNLKQDVAQMQTLLQTWPSLEPEQALELLDYTYADREVRKFAVGCLERMSDSDLLQYLLQLVQVLKYESYLDCVLAKFLIMRALQNQDIGHSLFWHLRAEMHNPEVSVRFGLILEAYCRGSPAHMKSLQQQSDALNKMKAVTELLQCIDRDKKDKALQTMKECLQQKTYQRALTKFNSPLEPSYVLKSLRVDKCKFMDSKMRPLWLVFHNVDDLGDVVRIIFKNGDDLRQDMLTLQLIKIMDKIWQNEGLDLGMIPYGCLSTGNHIGLIEVVPDSETIAKIQKKKLTGAFVKKCIFEWLKDYNPDEESLREAVRRFTLSCVGYCVATYVLGVGDRHSDNIMVTRSGQLFHIDFGHFLGNFKKKFGVKRERVPFVLTDHFVHVITNGKDKPNESDEFVEFKALCERAFLILRRKGPLLINLFAMMLSAGIPELQTMDDIGYLRQTLVLSFSEDKALEKFRKKFDEALSNSWKTSANWAIHNYVRDNP